MISNFELNEDQLTQSQQATNQLIDIVNHSVVGQENLTRSMVIALLTGGHVLLEGLPGTAKTRAVKALANTLNVSFSRVQFTPDLLPSDVSGTNIYDKDSGKLVFQKGPIFNAIVLADEINRAPAKVQAALLEAMAESTVTMGGETYSLPSPFMVLATQNPIEQEGTYPLPEAQMDRFIMKVNVFYPERNAEIDIIHLVRQEAIEEEKALTKEHFVLNIDDVVAGKEEVKRVYSSDSVVHYIVDLVMATRQPETYPNSHLSRWIEVGASPRASIALDNCSRANAWLEGRDYVMPDDVRSIAHSVLEHRITLSFEALSSSISKADVINELLDIVPLT
ncbi:MAG: MoxR family ATPase [Aliivibrio sp.]|nr:MoxR family ATPase [Aliivibrio sp.]